MRKYIIFGAGNLGEQAISLIGKEKIDYFIDNDEQKYKIDFHGFTVLGINDLKETLLPEQQIVIAVSEHYIKEIELQLKENKIENYILINDLRFKLTKEKILAKPNYTLIYNKAIQWIKDNSIPNEGIINSSISRKSYPEVTGYYIPALIRWGYKELAITYAKWLCTIQHENGAWYDTADKNPYVFDTAQVLKGLIAVRDLYAEVDNCIMKGCDWLLNQMTEEGRLVAPVEGVWGNGKMASELIHTYCISPIKDAGIIFKRDDYIKKADKIAEYYTTNKKDEILHFNLLSHFYAYVMEAMLDIGREDLAREAMRNIEAYQKESGAVPGYKDVDWVCSTGLFQLAIVWFRLGELERGNKAFEYACKLQNDTGGWFGSYLSEENPNEINTYIPNGEISWAVKYFLEALYYKNLVVKKKWSGKVK